LAQGSKVGRICIFEIIVHWTIAKLLRRSYLPVGSRLSTIQWFWSNDCIFYTVQTASIILTILAQGSNCA